MLNGLGQNRALQGVSRALHPRPRAIDPVGGKSAPNPIVVLPVERGKPARLPRDLRVRGKATRKGSP
jgi:hypothetical protein